MSTIRLQTQLKNISITNSLRVIVARARITTVLGKRHHRECFPGNFIKKSEKLLFTTHAVGCFVNSEIQTLRKKTLLTQ